MTNMQMRKTQDKRTRSILRRLQDRVLGMAAVHRSLYETTSLSEVRADRILREVAKQLMRNMAPAGSGINLDIRTQSVSLYPDQALPLSLLLTEAMTNAVKYIGRPEDGQARILVDLTVEEGSVQLVVENTLGEELPGIEEMESSGLGSQLIAAFTMQLGAEATTEQTASLHRLIVRFERSDFSALPPGSDENGQQDDSDDDDNGQSGAASGRGSLTPGSTARGEPSDAMQGPMAASAS
jgi:two-component sensor histidine kinase